MSPNKRQFTERLNNLMRLGYMVAEKVSATIEKKYNVADSVKFADATDFLIFNQRYWSLVDEFKMNNDFPNGNKINSPKKAAITIYTAATNATPLFQTRFQLDKSHADYALLRFSLATMEMFMGVALKKINFKHKRDLNSCLFHLNDSNFEFRHANLRLLCLYMDTYWDERLENADLTYD